MKSFTTLGLMFLLISLPSLSFANFAKTTQASPLYELKVKNLSGKEEDLLRYRGKVLLIVNIASRCGYTPQMKDLQSLQTTYEKRGFSVLAFPSNDFKQEPLSGGSLASQAKESYGVTFPIFEKGSVTGPKKQPVFAFLTQSRAGLLGNEINWNFEKFLVNKQGELIGRWGSQVSPTSPEIEKAIRKALSE